MRRFRRSRNIKLAGKIATGIIATMMMAGSAVAADIPQIVTPVAPPPPPAPTFDWGGIYVGPHVSALIVPGCEFGECGAWEFGGQVGYNFVFGNFIVGPELNIGVFDDGGISPVHASLTARGGVLLGGNLLAYAEIGFWRYIPFTINCPCGIAGIGVEYAIGNALSVFGEVKKIFDDPSIWLQIGVNWHPGN